MSPESGHYELLLEQYHGATEAEQDAARRLLDECVDGFGDDFYDSRPAVMMRWADLGEEDRDKIAAVLDETADSEEGE